MIFVWSMYGPLTCIACRESFAEFHGKSNGEVPKLCLDHAVSRHGMVSPGVALWEAQPIADQVKIVVGEGVTEAVVRGV